MKKQPNVVFVLTDDHSYGDLHCTGNPIIQTPNIDAFYNESTRLTNFHVGPTCAPTRSGLMTGHYANSTGVWHTIGGRSLLRKDEWTIASALKENGYKTAIFGKWHLGDEYPYRPHERGFDTAIVHGGGGISQLPDWWGNDYFDDTYFVNGIPKQFTGYCTDVFFENALDYIEQNKDNPFFCYIACNAPHGPYNVDKKYSNLYKDQDIPEDRKKFYGMITNIDENFGVLRDKLKELDIEDQTILIFMTDNGSGGGVTLDQKGFLVDGFNGGLRGKKGSEYDGGHRVPFFIKYPDGGIDTAKDINELTANIDFMPTLLDLCHVTPKENVAFHGKSIKPLLDGKTKWEERTIVTDSQRLTNPVKWRKSAVMSERYRLVNGLELYDINKDKEQRTNIAHLFPEVVGELRNEYNKWWTIVSEKFDNDIPIAIGDQPTHFTTHDMRNEECETAWNQGQVREGLKVYGYFEIEVETKGNYEIQLRRWPASENIPISSEITGNDIAFYREAISEKDLHYYTGSTSLPIENAHITVQGNTLHKPVNKGDDFVSFTLDLEAGHTTLEAWFSDNQLHAITSAYFIDVIKQI